MSSTKSLLKRYSEALHNQTTRNHEGYPLVFHVLDFSLKLRNIIGDNDEKHKRAKTRPLSAQSSLSSKFFVLFTFIGYKRVETWVPGRAQLGSVVTDWFIFLCIYLLCCSQGSKMPELLDSALTFPWHYLDGRFVSSAKLS